MATVTEPERPRRSHIREPGYRWDGRRRRDHGGGLRAGRPFRARAEDAGPDGAAGERPPGEAMPPAKSAVAKSRLSQRRLSGGQRPVATASSDPRSARPCRLSLCSPEPSAQVGTREQPDSGPAAERPGGREHAIGGVGEQRRQREDGHDGLRADDRPQATGAVARRAVSPRPPPDNRRNQRLPAISASWRRECRRTEAGWTAFSSITRS